ncbi:MAG TPA: tyrosine-type recombinase/integrase [Candidatus Baltobacterales bacterium]|nr:tyrosine-type recombinase/integrase [Candidatus Baltobacterales bacterium]
MPTTKVRVSPASTTSTVKVRVLSGGAASEIEQAITDYLVSVDARTRNSRTRDFYAFGLERVLLPFCRAQGITRLDQLDQRVIDRLAAELNSRRKENGDPLSPASVATYLRASRQFMKWAAGRVPAGVTVPRPSVPKQDLSEKVLTRTEMTALVESAPTVRDQALLELLCSRGLRLGEALALTVDDVQDRGRAGRFVLIRHRLQGGGAKGDSGREVPIRPSLYARLHQLTLRRPPDALTNRLFITSRRRHGEYTALAKRSAENMVDVAAERAGITKRVYPHLLRHSFATDWMRRRNDPVTLQRLLGHADLDMISSTYAHPSSSDLYDATLAYDREDED